MSKKIYKETSLDFKTDIDDARTNLCETQKAFMVDSNPSFSMLPNMFVSDDDLFDCTNRACNIPRCINIIDSSIWNYYSPIRDSEEDKIIRQIKENWGSGLYDLTITREYADYNARLLKESYLNSKCSGHAELVSPILFHSESDLRKKLMTLVNNGDYAFGKKWRILLVDDFAEKKLKKESGGEGELTKKDVLLHTFKLLKIYCEDVKVNNDTVKFGNDGEIKIECAKNLAEAVWKICNEGRYDIVLLDYLLEERVDGSREYGYRILEIFVVLSELLQVAKDGKGNVDEEKIKGLKQRFPEIFSNGYIEFDETNRNLYIVSPLVGIAQKLDDVVLGKLEGISSVESCYPELHDKILDIAKQINFDKPHEVEDWKDCEDKWKKSLDKWTESFVEKLTEDDKAKLKDLELVYYHKIIMDIANELSPRIELSKDRLDKIFGPNDQLFFMFESSFSSAITERIKQQGISRNGQYYYVSDGASPANTPWLFLYSLYDVMRIRYESLCVMDADDQNSPMCLVEFLYEQFKNDGPDTPSVRSRCEKHFDDFLRLRSLYDHIKDDKGSELVESIFCDKDCYNNAFWEHLQHLMYVVAYGTIRQTSELREEYAFVRARLKSGEEKYNERVEENKKKYPSRLIADFIYDMIKGNRV